MFKTVYFSAITEMHYANSSYWEEKAKVVRYIFTTYAYGHLLTFIANKLKLFCIPSPSSKPTWGRK